MPTPQSSPAQSLSQLNGACSPGKLDQGLPLPAIRFPPKKAASTDPYMTSHFDSKLALRSRATKPLDLWHVLRPAETYEQAKLSILNSCNNRNPQIAISTRATTGLLFNVTHLTPRTNLPESIPPKPVNGYLFKALPELPTLLQSEKRNTNVPSRSSSLVNKVRFAEPIEQLVEPVPPEKQDFKLSKLHSANSTTLSAKESHIMVRKSCIKCPFRVAENSPYLASTYTDGSPVTLCDSPVQEQFPLSYASTPSNDSKDGIDDLSLRSVVRCHVDLLKSRNCPSTSANTVTSEAGDVCTTSTRNQDEDASCEPNGGMSRMQNDKLKTPTGSALHAQTPNRVLLVSMSSPASMFPSTPKSKTSHESESMARKENRRSNQILNQISTVNLAHSCISKPIMDSETISPSNRIDCSDQVETRSSCSLQSNDCATTARGQSNKRLEKVISKQFVESEKSHEVLPMDLNDMNSYETNMDIQLEIRSKGAIGEIRRNISTDLSKAQLGPVNLESSGASNSSVKQISTNAVLKLECAERNPSAFSSSSINHSHQAKDLRLQNELDRFSLTRKNYGAEFNNSFKKPCWSLSHISVRTSSQIYHCSDGSELEDVNPDARSVRTVSVSSSDTPSTCSLIDFTPSPSEERNSPRRYSWLEFDSNGIDYTRQEMINTQASHNASNLSRRIRRKKQNHTTFYENEVICQKFLTFSEDQNGALSSRKNQWRKILDFSNKVSPSLQLKSDTTQCCKESGVQILSQTQDTLLWNSTPDITVISPSDCPFSELRSPVTSSLCLATPKVVEAAFLPPEIGSVDHVTLSPLEQKLNPAARSSLLNFSSESPDSSRTCSDYSKQTSDQGLRFMNEVSLGKPPCSKFESNQSRWVSEFESTVFEFPRITLRAILLDLDCTDFKVLMRISRALRVDLCAGEVRETIFGVLLSHLRCYQISHTSGRTKSAGGIDSKKLILKRNGDDFQRWVLAGDFIGWSIQYQLIYAAAVTEACSVVARES